MCLIILDSKLVLIKYSFYTIFSQVLITIKHNTSVWKKLSLNKFKVWRSRMLTAQRLAAQFIKLGLHIIWSQDPTFYQNILLEKMPLKLIVFAHFRQLSVLFWVKFWPLVVLNAGWRIFINFSAGSFYFQGGI